MAPPHYPVRYENLSTQELRVFVMRRLSLSGREYRRSSRRALVKRLHRLDEKATFKFMDLPAELRDQVYEQLASTMDLRRLLLVSKQIHTEAGACFYKSTRFFLTIQADSTRNYNLSAGNHTLRVSDAPLEAPGLVEVIQLCQHLSWDRGSPLQGISNAGIAFYSTSFKLDIPKGYDVPLSFVFANSTGPEFFRAQLYVNGWQFGKYIDHLGPQSRFPVPEGILDYAGTNYVAVTIWAQKSGGAQLEGLELVADATIQSAYQKPGLSWSDAWEERAGAY